MRHQLKHILMELAATCLEKKVCHFSPALACDCTIRSNTTFAEENSLYIASMSMSVSKPSAGHASERLLKLRTDFKDNGCSTDVIASEEKLNDRSKYETKAPFVDKYKRLPL